MPIEVYATIALEIIADIGIIIHTYPRADLLKILRTIERVKDCGLPIVLYAHTPGGLADQKTIRTIYSSHMKYIHMIVWDSTAPLYKRGTLRYRSFEVALRLFHKDVIILDDDLTYMREFLGNVGGEPIYRLIDTPRKKMLFFKRLIAQAREMGKWCVSIKDNTDRINKKRWSFRATVRSGVWCFMLDKIRKHRETAIGWNPFYRCSDLGMEEHEDLRASQLLKDMDVLANYHYAGWQGCRGGYDKKHTLQRVRDTVIVVSECDNWLASHSLKKRFYVGGSFNTLYMTAKGIKELEGVKTLDFETHGDHILKLTRKKDRKFNKLMEDLDAKT